MPGVNSLGTNLGGIPPNPGSNFQAAGIAMASTVDATNEETSNKTASGFTGAGILQDEVPKELGSQKKKQPFKKGKPS